MLFTAVLLVACALNAASAVDLRDADLDVPALVAKYGYPVEEHEVTTPDGYKLRMHRIPHGRDNNTDPSLKKKAVFCMHGLESSSADFITPGPGVALSYYLAEQGYDVWLGNARGNYYSRRHVVLNPALPAFWNFSWDEIGHIDLCTMIDFILNKTDSAAIHYVGHSQGTTTFLVMTSLKPEYNAKITNAVLLAPVAYFDHLDQPLLSLITQLVDLLEPLVKLLGLSELFPRGEVFEYVNGAVRCKVTYKLYSVCVPFLIAFNSLSNHYDPEMLPVLIGHAPAGASSRQPLLYAQNIKFKEFQRFDYLLPFQNLAAYGSLKPPHYNVSAVTANVSLIYAQQDTFASPLDVVALCNKLPNAESHLVPLANFTHFDFVWAVNAIEMVYETIVKSMRAFDTI